MPSLLEKYGGFARARTIVSCFYEKVLESDLLAPYFAATDMRRLIDHQTKFIAQVMGGPASYSSHDLERVHQHLRITDAAFEEMQVLLREALEEAGLLDGDVEAVCAEVRARRGVIVARS